MKVVKSKSGNRLNINSTIKIATNSLQELNQIKEWSDTKKENLQQTKAKDGMLEI